VVSVKLEKKQEGKMKEVLSLMAVAMFATPSSQALTCQAQMIHTICGTGKVEMVLNNSGSGDNSFKIINGDVACWNMELTIDGEADRQGKTNTYYEAESYKLLVKDHVTNTKVIYGFFHYDKTQKKARLTIDHVPNGLLSAKYDLDCN
jgi:hypothetical protein